MDRVQSAEVGEAQRLLGQVLAAVERGELGADGPAATALVHRLQGALLALQAQSHDQDSSSNAPRLSPRAVRSATESRIYF